MKDALDKEITGAPVMVAILGTVRRLEYPMHNVIVYKEQSGDSLWDYSCWKKIDLQVDPVRWLACLWAGLHQEQPDQTWKAPFTLDELKSMKIDYESAVEITTAIGKALLSFFPKAKEADPNGPAPAFEKRPAQTSPTPANSTPEQDAVSA